MSTARFLTTTSVCSEHTPERRKPRWSFDDVLLSMVYPFDPAWRGLVHGPGLGMWTFPDDYPRRVGDAVYQAAPQFHRVER